MAPHPVLSPLREGAGGLEAGPMSGRREERSLRHAFRVRRFGRGDSIIWFDAADFTREEAEAEFRPFHGVTRRGEPCTGYEYNGVIYRGFTYLGEFEDGQRPRNDRSILDFIFRRSGR